MGRIDDFFLEKRKECPCLDETDVLPPSTVYGCTATNGLCSLSGCPMYYWIFYVKK